MSTMATIVIVGAALAAAYGLFRVLRSQFRKAKAYIARVSQCGYMCPPPTKAALTFVRWFCGFVVKIQVGKIKVQGLENLKNAAASGGPLLITPNHPHYADPGVIALTLDKLRMPARYLAAQRLFRFAGGLPSLACGPCGAISVDLKPGQGGPARETAVKVLTSLQHLVMWPEAYAYMDGRLGKFKKGAVRIAQEATRQLGKPIQIVPVHIKYGRNPGKWINKYNEPVQYLIAFLNSWYYRRGVTVVIGKPISADMLPADEEKATEVLRATVASLSPVQPVEEWAPVS